MNKKRVWELLVQPAPDLGRVSDWQRCLICLASKESCCTDCEADKINYGTWCRDVWMTLLCGRNRRGTCLSLLNVHSLTLIYTYTIARNAHPSACPLTYLPCNSSYHEHCFLKWVTAKGPNCPNCGGAAWNPYTKERQIQFCATLLVYDTSDPKRGRHCDPPHLEAALVRILKHRDPREGGLSAEQLRGALTWSVEPTVVLFALKSLVGREYLTYDERTEMYQYNP